MPPKTELLRQQDPAYAPHYPCLPMMLLEHFLISIPVAFWHVYVRLELREGKYLPGNISGCTFWTVWLSLLSGQQVRNTVGLGCRVFKSLTHASDNWIVVVQHGYTEGNLASLMKYAVAHASDLYIEYDMRKTILELISYYKGISQDSTGWQLSPQNVFCIYN